MDRANKNSMITVDCTITTDLLYSASPRLIYEYAHGYDYTPQFWGLWDVRFANTFTASAPEDRLIRAYGEAWYGAAEPQAGFYYTVDSSHIRLYFHFDGSFPVSRPNPIGTTAVFTGYLFANDRTNQVYGQ